MTVATQTVKSILERFVVAEDPNAKARKRLTDLRLKLENFRGGDFFAFERADQQAEDLEEQIARTEKAIEMAELGYRALSNFSFLGWRKKDTQWPAFIIVDIQNEEPFSLSVEALTEDVTILDDVDITFGHDLPEAVMEQYDEVALHMGRLSADEYGLNRITISATLAGVMPKHAREATQEAMDLEIFDQIFIIGEAPAFKVDIEVSSKKDPIVVGWVEDTKQMFVITSYDPTDLEKYLLTQYTD